MSVADVTFDLTYYPIAVVTCLAFLFLYRYVSPALSCYIFPGYPKLTLSQQIYWRTSLHSTIHAFITSTLCVYTLLYEKGLTEDPIWHDSPIVKTSCAIVIGYMLSDSIIMVCNWSEVKDIKTLLHHIASIYAYYYVMTYGVYGYFANFRLMAEFSTPWVNNRWFLATMDVNKSGKVYMVNGVILTAVFFACRILSMPPCWYKIFEVYGTEPFLRTGNIKYVLLISCVVLDALNVMWFVKLVRGVRKTLDNAAVSNKNGKQEKME